MTMFSKAKAYLVVAVIAATVVAGGLVSADVPAGASTAACGSSCTSPSVESLGTGEVLAVSGSSVVMSAASTTNSAQDWTPEQEGDVSNAVSAGVVSPRLNLLYSTDQLVEFQYAPNGVPSDKCMSNTASPGQTLYSVPTLTVVMAQCGLTAQSLWIVDASNEANGYVDLINAGYEGIYTYLAPSSSQAVIAPYAEPAVLTVNSSGQVVLAFLSELGGVVSSSQMWAAWSSPAQSELRTAVRADQRKLAAKFG
jgi:hypothetical protein